MIVVNVALALFVFEPERRGVASPRVRACQIRIAPPHSRAMATRNLVAVDLGAESGRVILGTWNGKRLGTREIHRFSNGPLRWNGSLRWNVVEIWAQILRGLAIVAKETNGKVDGISVDSWGVDYVLLSATGELVGLPVSVVSVGPDREQTIVVKN